jgi:hypothetical protein
MAVDDEKNESIDGARLGCRRTFCSSGVAATNEKSSANEIINSRISAVA